MKYLEVVMIIISTISNCRLTELCNIRVCLTWSVRMGHLNLICRVNNLYHTVEFFDNMRKEQGFCVHPNPVSECHSLHSNVTVIQNTKTNVTTLTIRGKIDRHFNGEWKCAHGTNVDVAIVNVTVLTIEGTAREQDSKCWEAYLTWPLLVFVFIYTLAVAVFVWSRKRMGYSKKHDDPNNVSESTLMTSVGSSSSD